MSQVVYAAFSRICSTSIPVLVVGLSGPILTWFVCGFSIGLGLAFVGRSCALVNCSCQVVPSRGSDDVSRWAMEVPTRG